MSVPTSLFRMGSPIALTSPGAVKVPVPLSVDEMKKGGAADDVDEDDEDDEDENWGDDGVDGVCCDMRVVERRGGCEGS